MAFLSDFPLLSYIDPGVTSLAIQAFFALVFGALATWVLAPWRFIASLFGRGKRAELADDDDTTADSDLEEHSDEHRDSTERHKHAA